MILTISFVTYRIYTRSFYDRYRTQMESIVTYSQQFIDDDDMSECADTFVETEKYKETREILDGTEDVFFLQESAWGLDYTLARPLIDSSGKHYGLLCVDVSGDELKDKLYRSIFINVAVIVCMGIAMMLALLLWMRIHVTVPLNKLEDSVKDYTKSLQNRSNWP